MMKYKKILVLFLIILVLFLIVGVPLLINWLYSLPPIFYTNCSAADVLGYYGTLLGTAAAILTLYFGLWQYRTEHRLRREAKMWEDIDAMFRQCLDDIHPSKLEMALLTSLPHENPYGLITETLAFRVAVITSVDRLVSSIQNISDTGLHDLKNQLISFKKKLLLIEEQYSTLQQKTILDGCKPRFLLCRSKRKMSAALFAKEREAISAQIQELYDKAYCNLLTSREDFFRKKHDEIAGKSSQHSL